MPNTAEIKTKPYIGVTGITRDNEADLVRRTFDESLSPNDTHQGMAGYLVSNEYMRAVSQKNSRYVPLAQLRGLMTRTESPGILNMIHFGTDQRRDLAGQITQVFESDHLYDDGICRAVQLNMSWPPIDQLAKIKESFPSLQVVLSLTRGIFANNSRYDISKRLAPYPELVDYILIDPSGGHGVPFEADDIAKYYRSLDHDRFSQPVILAGGFDASNVDSRLEDISRRLGTKHFGIDAERNLRTPRDNDFASLLDLGQTARYIQKAARFFNTPYPNIFEMN